MSFSGEVKEELAGQISSSRHCQIAELAAMVCYSGRLEQANTGNACLTIQAENEKVIRKGFTLLQKSFNICTGVTGKGPYFLKIEEKDQVSRLLQSLKLSEYSSQKDGRMDTVNPLLIKNACCRRAYLRGAFLTTGSMSDPEKSYHLE